MGTKLFWGRVLFSTISMVMISGTLRADFCGFLFFKITQPPEIQINSIVPGRLRAGTLNLMHLDLYHYIHNRSRLSRFDIQEIEARTRNLAAYILEGRLDVLAFQEMESKESAEQFLKMTGLKNKYEFVGLESKNRDHSINGFLVKKDLAVEVELQSFNHLTFYDELFKRKEAVFPKGVQAIHLFIEGADKPLLSIVNFHMKSKADREHRVRGHVEVDPKSEHMREAQRLGLRTIQEQILSTFGKDHEIMFLGDFNHDLRKDTSIIEVLSSGKLSDVFDISPSQFDYNDRFSHVLYIQRNHHQLVLRQVDGIYVTESLKSKVIKSQIHAQHLSSGKNRPIPQNEKEWKQFLTDHLLISTEINLN